MINIKNDQNKFQTKRLIVCFMIWIWWIILYFRKKRDYIALTPPIFGKKILYYRLGGFFNLKLRDLVDYNTFLNVFNYEEFSLKKLRRWNEIKKIAITNSLILDCGGNIGLASVFFTNLFNNSNVVCIEPSNANILEAKKNYSGIIINGAVSNLDGIAYQSERYFTNTAFQITEEFNNGEKINVYSINSILKQFDNLKPFIIKIDIEGYEKYLFADSCEWMDKFYIIIIELHDWMLPNVGNSNSFVKQLALRNFDIIVSHENLICIRN